MRKRINNVAVIMCMLVTLVILLDFRCGYIQDNNNKISMKPIRNIKGHVINGKRFLEARATRWTSDMALHRYFTTPDVSCRKTIRAGHEADGGWHVCLSEPFLLKPPCLVYSFGINYDFSFDDAVAKYFNCTVKSFDPSMTKARNHKRGKYIEFYKDGISGKDFLDGHGWQLYSLATILKNQNDTNRIIDYLKMDVEHSEWEAIPDMAAKNTLRNIKQIGVEIHRRVPGETKCTRLIDILEDNGFRKWRMDYNTKSGYKMPDGNQMSEDFAVADFHGFALVVRPSWVGVLVVVYEFEGCILLECLALWLLLWPCHRMVGDGCGAHGYHMG